MDNVIVCCPFCRSIYVVQHMIVWTAQSQEPLDSTNTAHLHENQCTSCKQSFWSEANR
jgi:hypothetical protein